VLPAELLRRPRYEVFPLAGIADEVAARVPRDLKITVTSSPTRGIDVTLGLTEALATRGFTVAPHLAARLFRDAGHLAEVVSRLRETGVRDVLVIGGDVPRPVGEFRSAYELLAALEASGHPFADVGIAGYPESHPFISQEEVSRALSQKAPLSTYLVSQLCLDARVIAAWIADVRARGVTLPIYVGIPGVVPRRKLLRISTRIGVGESTRFLRKHGGMLGRLLLRGSVGPDHLLAGLAGADVAGLHVYTFNELAETERWRRQTLARRDRVAA
jgi:methylenetetrahydrofolate reductase (NADH)